MGFAGALVGGPSSAAVAVAAVDIALGQAWFEGGTFRIRYARPVYDRDEVRVAWQSRPPQAGESARIELWIEKRSGECTAFGSATVAAGGTPVTPPWQSEVQDPAAAAAAVDLVPEIRVGATQPPVDCRSTDDASRRAPHLLDAVGNATPWYRTASPFGGAILSPLGIAELTRQAPGTLWRPFRARVPTVMDAGFDIAVHAPLFVGEAYRVASALVEKGCSARSLYWVVESRVTAADGRPVADVRFRSRHLLADLR